jgi:AcrR family transcriptional regulator
MPRTGRRPGATGTRERIVAAAQQAFADAGFDGATIRRIGADAGVDPALIHHYFGSKEELFIASMRLPFDPQELARTITQGGVDGVGERIMRFAIGIWRQPGLRSVITGVARSAASDERAAGLLRDLLARTLLPAVEQLGLDHAELRASLLWSEIIGLVFGRFVVGVPALAQADPELLASVMAPILQATLTAPIPEGGMSAGPASLPSRP